jgi:hypothetical protein
LKSLNPMTDRETGDLPVVQTPSSPCLHLRSKGMYVDNDGPGGTPEDDDDNTAYWCFKTLKSFGPDDEMVGGRLCRNGSRSCYEPI